MKENPVKWFGYLFSFTFLIISCAKTGTDLTQEQVDDAYKEQAGVRYSCNCSNRQ